MFLEMHAASFVTAMNAFIALMMKAASISETSENVYQTTGRNNPEASHLHTSHHENLKSQSMIICNNTSGTQYY
jgi:hypothetical protein